VIGVIVAAVFVSSVNPSIALLAPGYRYGLILLGIDPFMSLLLIAVPATLLTCADYAVQREVVYSGVTGPAGARTLGSSKGRFLLFRASPGAALWRISLLGWIRHRNALLVLIAGSIYGFTYMYLTKPSHQVYLMAFCWMFLIFHAYLRGNLLGVDNRAVWLYYMLPVPPDAIISAKNSTLTVVQLCMIGAALLPAALGLTTGMTTVLEWVSVLSFACCGVLLGEIFGSVFSVLYPRPIDRSSMYSGGTTPGALLVPLIQSVTLIILVVAGALAGRFLATFPTIVLFVLAPASLWALRSAVLRVWVRRRMLRQKSAILRKLMSS
jgi:hypothetical protein